MKRLLYTIVAIGLVGASSASASCRLLGTQLDCTLGSRELVIGTQAASEPSYAGELPALSLHGSDSLFDEHAAIGAPLRLELQNFGTDPGLCWRFGDEIYCH